MIYFPGLIHPKKVNQPFSYMHSTKTLTFPAFCDILYKEYYFYKEEKL